VVKVSSRSGDPVDPEDRTGAGEKLREFTSLSNHRVTLTNVEVQFRLFGQTKTVIIPSLIVEGDPADWPAQIVRQVPELAVPFELYDRIKEARTNPALAKRLAQGMAGVAGEVTNGRA